MANKPSPTGHKRKPSTFTIKEMHLDWLKKEAELSHNVGLSEIVNRAIEYYKEHGPTASSEQEEELRKAKEYDEILGTPNTVEELYSTD